MKRKFLIVISILVLTTVSADKARFDGIKYEDTESEYAIMLFKENIFKGECIDGKYYFKPNCELTRGEFLVWLISALKINTDNYEKSTFSFADAEDIPSWLLPYAKASYGFGIIKGNEEYDKIYLKPNDIITRIEAITMINNIINHNSDNMNTADFEDMYLVPEWGQEAVKNASSLGIISGYSDNTVRPYVKVTREDAAELLCNLISKGGEIISPQF